ncbi:hexitol phosphatase HxpB [Chromatiaceae bacterium AAb-1]|nr:hexitol phosphatase HxpB [Chromatiaceae bacterium AAb-1]
MNPGHTQAVIFDMDGLLLDSEPFWQQAEFEVFSSLGVKLTPADCQKTIGWRCDTVVNFWYQQYPWGSESQESVANRIIDRVILQMQQQGQLLPGATAALQLCQHQQKPVGLATSSAERLMLAMLEHFNLKSYFNACCSAQYLPYAKPHPQVYLNAAEALNVQPERCLALEDSITGMIAAKAARMRCYVVPDSHQARNPGYALADKKLSSLHELTAGDLY